MLLAGRESYLYAGVCLGHFDAHTQKKKWKKTPFLNEVFAGDVSSFAFWVFMFRLLKKSAKDSETVCKQLLKTVISNY